jgi:hypothetical protein
MMMMVMMMIIIIITIVIIIMKMRTTTTTTTTTTTYSHISTSVIRFSLSGIVARRTCGAFGSMAVTMKLLYSGM